MKQRKENEYARYNRNSFSNSRFCYALNIKKQIIKLSDIEKDKNKAFIRVCEEIDESDFDNQLETLKF